MAKSWAAGIEASGDCRDQWLECARAAFANMDWAEKGHITSSQLVSLLSTKLPAEEVEHAVEDALMEAGCGGESSASTHAHVFTHQRCHQKQAGSR